MRKKQNKEAASLKISKMLSVFSGRTGRIARRGLALATALTITLAALPVTALAGEAEPRTGEGGAVHDYGKSGDDPLTNEDESAIVSNEEVLKSAQYQESAKYELKANGTPVSVYKYQKQSDPGRYYHMDVARFSSDDAKPVFEVTLKDGTTIDSVTAYPERYYPQDAFTVSDDKKTVTFRMSEGLRYCILNINGTQKDTDGKPQLAIINDPTEVKPDLTGNNVLNFKEFSDNYLKEHPITDKVNGKCRDAGSVTDTSLNNGTEYTWNYDEGVYKEYTEKNVTFPNMRARLSYDVSDAFQAALEEVRKSNTLDTIYFPAGTYVWSGLSIKNWNGNGADGSLTIYTDEDALLVNRLQECQEAMEPAIGIWDSSNITISGRGIYDGQGTYTFSTDSFGADRSGHQGGCMLVRSQDITFNDTYVRDVKQWNWECHTVQNVTYNNIKGLSPFQHSWVDGLDLTSGKNITVNGAITMGNDDTFAAGHFNPSDGFPKSSLNGQDMTKLSGGLTNIAAAAGIYNKDRLQWDQDDSENCTVNNSLGWSTFANAVRLGHNTRWKADGGSYQMKSYTFNNVNTVHVTGWSPNGGGGALSIQNATNGCHPNYERLVFNNCSFADNGGNNLSFPKTTNLTNFHPEEVTIKDCWFNDADAPLEFRNIKNVTVEDLHLGGKLVEYKSQLKQLTVENVDHFTFTANGKNIKENELPVITVPGEKLQAYAENPLIFYLQAEDPDGDEVTIDETDVSAMTGAAFDRETGKFSWTPSKDEIGNTYEVTFKVSDYTGQPVKRTVRIEVVSPSNSAESFPVAEDAHIQSWKGEKEENFGNTRYLTTVLIPNQGLMNEKFTNTSTSDGTDGKIIYLKFDLANIKEKKGQYDKAELMLTYLIKRRNANTDETNRVRVAAIENSGWSEESITWNTKPAFPDSVTDENAKVSETFSMGTVGQDKPSGDNQAINGARVKTDITKFITDAINAGKDSLTLAVCETGGTEIYFVSSEGAAGFKNATADMVPSILLNLPVAIDIEGPSDMTITKGYEAAESSSFALKGTGSFNVELSCENGEGKISWNQETQQIQVAKGLDVGTYEVTLTVTNGSGDEKTTTFTLNVVPVDKTKLQAAFDAACGKKQENYTPESWTVFAEALAKAQEVLGDGNATREQVDQALSHLNDASVKLVEKAATEAELQALQSLYDASLEKKKADYTTTTWKAFSEALDEARRVLGEKDAVREAVIKATQTLTAAINGLKETGDRARLNAAISDAESKKEDNYKDLKNTWTAVQDALGKAKETAGNEDAGKEAVDEAIELLEQSLKDLEERSAVKNSGESAALSKAIEEAETAKESDYTAASWTAMKEALGEARTVRESETATLAEVGAAREALRTAISNLVRVDKTGLNAAIALAEGEKDNEKVYTAKSWDALQKALKEAKEIVADGDALQKAVDEKTSGLRKALRELEERTSVLKVALGNAIDREKGLKEENYYTASSWAELQTALEEAKKVQENDAASQEEVNNAAAALREAFEKLKVSDKTGLQAAIDHAKQLQESAYAEKPEAWAAMKAALADAESLKAEPDALQAEIDEATRILYAAVFDLDPETINKNGLNVAISRAEGLGDRQGNYRASGWAALQAALTEAKEVSQNEAATQEDVIAVTVALRNLENVDKYGLNAAIERAKKLKEEDYKDKADQWKIMSDELEAAEKIVADEEAVQKDVDAATYQLSESIRQLEAKTTIDKEELKTAVERTKTLDKGTYTETTWKALEKALEDAGKVLADEKVTQEEVDAATKALRDAMIALEGANKTGLNTIINYADEMEGGDYTAESWAAMQETLDAVKEIAGNPNATQQQINDACTRLSEALRKLEKKAANKDVLRDKYNEAKGISPDGYTAESYAALIKVLEEAEVILNKDTATQSEVHARTQALDDAIKALRKVEKPEGNNGGNTGQTVIRPESVKTRKISFAQKTYKIAAGKKLTLKPQISPENATDKNLKWETSNKKYAVVNSKGVVTTKKAGAGKTVVVTATAKDGSKKQAKARISIMKNAVTKITLKVSKKTLKAGERLAIKAAVRTNGKKSNKTLKWSCSNTKYAAVSSKGVVKAKKAGAGKNVTITARATDGSNKKARVKIKIKK